MTGLPPPARSGGLSLYADLLDPPTDSSTSISRAPVVSQEALDAVKEQETASSKRPIDPALRFQPFQPIRRPQQKTQKPKASFPKVVPAANANAPSSGIGGPDVPAPKTTLADWTVTEDDEWIYAGADKRARGGRKKKKKRDIAPVETNWDEIYDPTRPTNVDEYLRSDERVREVREWKALLYRHRKPVKRQSSWDSEEDEGRPPVMNQFAPPDSYSFAPPPQSPPRASIPDDKTGHDAYTRRLAISKGSDPPPPPPQTELDSTPAPPPPAPEIDSATISRAPIRYAQPQPDTNSPSPPTDSSNLKRDPDAMDQDVPSPEEPEMQTKRPGQKGFAARLMSKYGWSKGQGLGAEASGIVQPLRVQVEKRKKRSDAEGGGWAQPGGMGKILAPKQAASQNTSSAYSDSKFGPMSNVIVVRHMLEGMQDLQHEMEEGLGQEIGEECGDKYGRVERLYIDVVGRAVYIKFVEAVSALRAVNALDGRIFAGNTIEPRFYDVEQFEKGVYES